MQSVMLCIISKKSDNVINIKNKIKIYSDLVLKACEKSADFYNAKTRNFSTGPL